MKSRLGSYRKFFLIVFILSSLFVCLLLIVSVRLSPSPGSSPGSSIIIYIPLFTSVITFLGFVVTSILSIRREKREAREAGLSQKLKEIELERARFELEQLKKQVNKKKK